MHYNFLFNGCSWTFGAELEGITDNQEHRRTHRFSHLIAENYNKTYDNISKSGKSNDSIVRTTIEWFEQGNTCDIAIIQFSTISRIEYISEVERHLVNFTSQSISLRWKTDSSKIDYKITEKAHNSFYKDFYNVNLGLYNFYKNLFVLEQYFEKKNIPHIFLRLTDDKHLIMNNNQNLFNDTKFYWKSLCKHDYFDLYSLKGEILEMHNRKEYLKYTTENYTKEGFKYLTGTHPNELGHQKIAKFIINKLNK
jgi:hypothetical protein